MSFGRVQEVSSPAIATSVPVRHLGVKVMEVGGEPAHETYYPCHKLKRKDVSLRCVCVCVKDRDCMPYRACREGKDFNILGILRTLMS